MLVSGTITTDEAGADINAKRLDERNKEVIFKTCAPFTDCISEINITQIDNAKDLDVACRCIIKLNIEIIVQKHQEVCGNITEMSQMIF